jgi:hypothetical protein
VADIQGYFNPGAFDDVVDQRLLDTRGGPRKSARSQTMISGRPNTTGIVSLVVTDTSAPGYIQVLDCGADPGATSNLNADRVNQTRATLAFVRFNANGQACVYNQMATHLIADLQGYLSDGSFFEVTDTRLIDTRNLAPRAAASSTVFSGIPNRTAVVSIVATRNQGPGYVQLLPCGITPGASSNLNTDAPDQTVAGLAFVHFDSQGLACAYNEQPTDLIIDLQGYLQVGAFDDITDVRVLDSRTRQ